MSIQEHLNKIRNAVYGHEVRESIAKGIETAYDDASENGNANMEVKIARGTHPNLRSRLEEVDNKQQQNTAQLQHKRDTSTLINIADLSQDVKTAMTGGSVAVVGAGAVTKENLANDVKAEIQVSATNLMDNGNFVDFTGWNILNATQVVSNNEVTVTPTAKYGQISKSVPIVVGNKYYVRARVKATSNLVGMNFFTASLDKHSGSGAYETLSGIDTALTGTSKSVVFVDSSESTWSAFSVAKVFIVDLTAVFGVGKEPTLTQMDDLVNSLPTQWFSGTDNLFMSKWAIEEILLSANKNAELEAALDAEISKNIVLKDNQAYSEYEVVVANKTSVAYTNKQVFLNVNFSYGECKNENCLRVETDTGVNVPFQWEDEDDVNFEFFKNRGRYADGSLKSGKIWVTFGSLAVDTSRILKIKVYPKEVTTPTVVVTETIVPESITLTSGTVILNFLASNKYFLQTAKVNSVDKKFSQYPSVKTGLGVVVPVITATTTLNKMEVVGNGVVFKEMVLDYTLTDYNINLIFKTRLFKNGLIQQTAIYKPLVTMSTDAIEQMLNRVSVTPEGTINTGSGDIASIGWNTGGKNYSGVIMNANGDIPRGGGSAPDLPALAQINSDFPSVGDKELTAGWSQTTTQTYLANKPFLSTIEVNFDGYTDSLVNEEIRGLNVLSAHLVNKNKYRIKSETLNLIGNETRHYLETFETVSGSTVNAYTPAVLGELALLDLYGKGNLDAISLKYKNLVNTIYGAITSANLWNKYVGGTLTLEIAGRCFPIAETFYRRYLALGNTVEADFYKNIISSYAEMMCLAYEHQGHTGLVYEAGDNSNAAAMGLHGLALGLNVMGDTYDSRWVTAYNALLAHYLNFVKLENFVTDLEVHNLSNSHYYHYALFSMFEYSLACDLRGTEPAFDLTKYINQATSAYGAPKEHKYCISSSRRGQPLTPVYAIYLLMRHGNVSDYAQAQVMLEHLASQDIPTSGIQFPMDKFYNPSSGLETNLSFTLQVMYSIIDLLSE